MFSSEYTILVCIRNFSYRIVKEKSKKRERERGKRYYYVRVNSRKNGEAQKSERMSDAVSAVCSMGKARFKEPRGA